MTIRICVAGVTGWTGSAVTAGVLASEDLELSGAVSRSAAGTSVREALGIADAPDLPIEAWTDDDMNREILRTAVAYDAMISDGVERLTAIRRLTALDSPPPAFLTDALSAYEPDRRDLIDIQIGVKDLVAGMELTGDVVMSTGSKLASPGTPLTSALIQRIRAFAKTSGIEEPISVRVSAAQVARVKS